MRTARTTEAIRTLTSIFCSAASILGVLRTHFLTAAQQKCRTVRQDSLWHEREGTEPTIPALPACVSPVFLVAAQYPPLQLDGTAAGSSALGNLSTCEGAVALAGRGPGGRARASGRQSPQPASQGRVRAPWLTGSGTNGLTRPRSSDAATLSRVTRARAPRARRDPPEAGPRWLRSHASLPRERTQVSVVLRSRVQLQ